jgi:hypothetical protein
MKNQIYFVFILLAVSQACFAQDRTSCENFDYDRYATFPDSTDPCLKFEDIKRTSHCVWRVNDKSGLFMFGMREKVISICKTAQSDEDARALTYCLIRMDKYLEPKETLAFCDEPKRGRAAFDLLGGAFR